MIDRGSLLDVQRGSPLEVSATAESHEVDEAVGRSTRLARGGVLRLHAASARLERRIERFQPQPTSEVGRADITCTGPMNMTWVHVHELSR